MVLQIQNVTSYMYAIGGSKLIDIASASAMMSQLPGAISSPYLYSNTTTTIISPVFQLGFGPQGWLKLWIVIFVLNSLLTTASAVLSWWYPLRQLDPLSPLSMVLLAMDNSLLDGGSIGALPNHMFWQKPKFPHTGVIGQRHKPDPQVLLSNALTFGVEANENHLRLVTRGRHATQLQDPTAL
jgi:hypothetical protein